MVMGWHPSPWLGQGTAPGSAAGVASRVSLQFAARQSWSGMGCILGPARAVVMQTKWPPVSLQGEVHDRAKARLAGEDQGGSSAALGREQSTGWDATCGNSWWATRTIWHA